MKYTQDEMIKWLQKHLFRVAKWPAYFSFDTSEHKIDDETTVMVAFKKSEREELEEMYWAEDIEDKFGIKTVFEQEMKKALLKL